VDGVNATTALDVVILDVLSKVGGLARVRIVTVDDAAELPDELTATIEIV
jgi:hypothetical protein